MSDAGKTADAPKTQAEIDAEVEAKKAEAVKSLAEARKAEAEVASLAAKTRREVALAMAAEAELYDAEVTKARQEELRRRELAADCYHHVYQFTGAVRSESVASCVKELSYWHRQYPKCDMEIIFNSPGGSVIDGLALYDYLTYLRAQGHHLTTTAIGYAASMAGVLLQAGDTRVMGREAYILIHEVSFGVGGKIGEVEDEVAFVKKIQDRVLTIFSERSLAAQPKTGLTKKQFANRWRRKDWWLDSDSAYRLGIVDEVR